MAIDTKKIEEILQRDLFKELKLDDISYEERMGVLDDMSRVVVQGIWIRILENLNNEDQVALEKVLDESDEHPEQIMIFLQEKIPNLSDLIKEEIANYKSIILGI